MSAYFAFLRRHPGWWLPPILLYLAVLAWLAWRSAHTAVSPFTYEL